MIANDFFVTFFVITDPAPTTLFLPIFIGATKDELDPIIGRNNEIQRVSQILSRRKKNNPILI